MTRKSESRGKVSTPRKPKFEDKREPEAGMNRKESQGKPQPDEPNIMERGDIFFFYRPRDENSPPSGLIDVNRFHVVLRPEGKEVLRYITVGKKKLPSGKADNRFWAFVDGVYEDADSLRQALVGHGDDQLGGVTADRAGAVPAGGGVYALVRQGRTSLLAYELELPEEPGEVQRTFNISHQGRLSLILKNPRAGSPAGVGLETDRQAEFPEELQEQFGNRKWIGAMPEFLNHEGAELLLVAGDDLGTDLELDLEPETEEERSAELIEELRLNLTERTIKPLFEGSWT